MDCDSLNKISSDTLIPSDPEKVHTFQDDGTIYKDISHASVPNIRNRLPDQANWPYTEVRRYLTKIELATFIYIIVRLLRTLTDTVLCYGQVYGVYLVMILTWSILGGYQAWGQFHFVNSNSTSNLSIPILNWSIPILNWSIPILFLPNTFYHE